MPVQAIQALPYVLTVVLLAGFIGHARRPRRSGVPYREGALNATFELDACSPRPRAARGHAYAPYSNFAVGAALLDEQGRIHAGCNVENAAYPQGLCAEAGRRSATWCSPAAGASARWPWSAKAPRPVTPCGGCRQKLREFAGDDVPVLVGRPDERCAARYTLGELLPASFGPEHLK